MGRCFVIQPFDKGAYDKRYEDVIVAAITDAGLDDYRVDRDPAISVLIEAIEEGIRCSDACIAEITTDNPNVWYEEPGPLPVAAPRYPVAPGGPAPGNHGRRCPF